MKKQKISPKKAKNNFFEWSLLSMLALGLFLCPNTAFLKTISRDNIQDLINQERQKAGLEELRNNEILEKAARSKAEAIFSEQEFAHEIGQEKFSYWVKAAGYKYSYIGENLAIDFISAEGALKAWLDSNTHKQNILNPRFTETGVAIKEGTFKGINTILVVQIFGTPLYSPPGSFNASETTAFGRQKNELNLSFSFRPQTDSSLYYYDNFYTDASQADRQSSPMKSLRPADLAAFSQNNGLNLMPMNKTLEKFNAIFILTFVLSLFMLSIYFLSNRLLKEKLG